MPGNEMSFTAKRVQGPRGIENLHVGGCERQIDS